MNQHSTFEEGFADRHLDVEQHEGILYCNKNESNGWYTLDEYNKKIWNNAKVNLFWNLIQSELDAIYRKYLIDTDLINAEYILSNVVFPKFQDEVEYFSPASNENEMGTNFYSYREFEHHNQQAAPEVNTIFQTLIVSFENCIFLDDANFDKYSFEYPLVFNNCTFESEILLNKIYTNRISFLECNIQNLNCTDITFEQKVKIQKCTINGKSNFYNTKFKELADFYRTTFNEVIFERTDFEDIAVFSEAEFSCDVNFKYTKFLGKSIFRDTVIKGKLNLRDTIFDDDATFLDITSEKRKRHDNNEFYGEAKVIQVANRETARIIKNFYDKSNNIIEANKFYALEMEERKKELDAKSNFFEWIVFYFHRLSSNHSQSWSLSLFWIGLLGIFYTLEIHNIPFMTFFITLITIDAMIEYFFKKYTSFMKLYNKLPPFVIVLYTSYLFIINVGQVPYLMSMEFLDDIAKNIFIFSKFDAEDMTFWFLLYKITLSYLYYQFIISVRQNTRRK